MSWRDFYLFLAAFNNTLESYFKNNSEVQKIDLAQGIVATLEKNGFSLYICEDLWEVVMDTQNIKRKLNNSIRKIEFCGSIIDLYSFFHNYLQPKKVLHGKNEIQKSELSIAQAA